MTWADSQPATFFPKITGKGSRPLMNGWMALWLYENSFWSPIATLCCILYLCQKNWILIFWEMIKQNKSRNMHRRWMKQRKVRLKERRESNPDQRWGWQEAQEGMCMSVWTSLEQCFFLEVLWILPLFLSLMRTSALVEQMEWENCKGQSCLRKQSKKKVWAMAKTTNKCRHGDLNQNGQ